MKKQVLPLLSVLLFFSNSPLWSQTKNFSFGSNELGEYFSLDQVYNKYSCGGKNISPELHWKNPPSGTKSFAIIMFDPDAPDKGWWHWLVFDIPAQVNHIPTGAGSVSPGLLPASAIQSINDYKEYGYGGPCPPPGKPHRYFIQLFALDTVSLGLDKKTSPWKVKQVILKHTLAKREMISLYGR